MFNWVIQSDEVCNHRQHGQHFLSGIGTPFSSVLREMDNASKTITVDKREDVKDLAEINSEVLEKKKLSQTTRLLTMTRL